MTYRIYIRAVNAAKPWCLHEEETGKCFYAGSIFMTCTALTERSQIPGTAQWVLLIQQAHLILQGDAALLVPVGAS